MGIECFKFAANNQNLFAELKKKQAGLENKFDKFLNGGNTYNLGYLYGFDYKGFKFYLKEEYNLNFVVRGYKRRYAVVTDLSGREIIQSDYSFTLEPEVLVDQIRVEIDLKNLSA
jgi:hypothetical protein